MTCRSCPISQDLFPATHLNMKDLARFSRKDYLGDCRAQAAMDDQQSPELWF
jgi:hypothetical protein